MKTTGLEISKLLDDALKMAGYIHNPLYRTDINNQPMNVRGHGLSCMLEMKIFNAQLTDSERAYIEECWESHPKCFYHGELWDMLPDKIDNSAYNKCMDHNTIGYIGTISKEWGKHYYYYDNPCNELAKLVVWCVKNNHPLNLAKDEKAIRRN